MGRTRLLTVVFSASLGVIIACVGCAPRPEVITEDIERRRVHRFEVEGDWVVYSWAPAQSISSPTYLVLRNLNTGDERELVPGVPYVEFSLNEGRVAYRIRAEEPEVMLYDISTGAVSSVAFGRARGLDLSGDRLVWEENVEGGSTVIAQSLSTGFRQDLCPDAAVLRQYNRGPHIDGGTIVWIRQEQARGENRLYVHDLYEGLTTPTDIVSPSRFEVALSGDFVVYAFISESERTIHLYDISTGEDQVLDENPRLMSTPKINVDVVAWMDHIPKDEFKPMGSQPLIDERDFRNIYRYDIGKGKTTRVAKSLFACLFVSPGDDGHVYAAVQRHMTPSRSTNLIVPVDIRRW